MLNINYNYSEKDLVRVAAMIKERDEYEFFRAVDFDIMASYIAGTKYERCLCGLEYDFPSWEELIYIFAKVWIIESLDDGLDNDDAIFDMMIL